MTRESDYKEITDNIKKRRFEVVEKQNTLGGEAIDIIEFKGLEEKRKVKQKILDMFSNQMFRSVIVNKGITLTKSADLARLKDEKGYQTLDEKEKTLQRMENFSKKNKLTLSVFPEVITSAYTLLLSKEREKVFDAFAGHNSRASTVLGLNRRYVGYDVYKYAVDFTLKQLTDFDEKDYKIHLASSEKVNYPDASFDFSLTCPPYYDVEEYDKIYQEKSDETDLSTLGTYEEFLDVYKRCLSETYRVLKPNRYFVIVVGNIYRKKRMLNIMKDTIDICEKLGFSLHDINIYNRGSNIGGDMNYKLFINNLKRFPCIHEYILVFKKEVKEKQLLKYDNDKRGLFD